MAIKSKVMRYILSSEFEKNSFRLTYRKTAKPNDGHKGTLHKAKQKCL